MQKHHHRLFLQPWNRISSLSREIFHLLKYLIIPFKHRLIANKNLDNQYNKNHKKSP